MFPPSILYIVYFLMLALFCTSVLGRPNEELCAELHPEAKYMTPPDEEGTRRWFAKQVEDFSGFASCFDKRYGGAFAAEDFRPCNSIPGVSEDDRVKCLAEKANEERLMPEQWCSTRFDSGRDYDMWLKCTNEFQALNDMPLLKRSRPKTPAEMGGKGQNGPSPATQ